MPYRSKKKRQLYALKWRKKHRDYMRDYGRAYLSGKAPTCLLGRRVKCAQPVTPIQSESETLAGLQLPVHEHAIA